MTRTVRTFTLLSAIVLAAVLVISVAETPDSEAKPAPAMRDQPGVQLRMLMAGLRVQQEAGEMMEDPYLAGQLAVNRIKDIAMQTKKLHLGVKALKTIAREVELPAIRRSAMFALADLYVHSGHTDEAVELLTKVAMRASDEAVKEDEEDEDDDDDDADDDEGDDEDDDADDDEDEAARHIDRRLRAQMERVERIMDTRMGRAWALDRRSEGPDPGRIERTWRFHVGRERGLETEEFRPARHPEPDALARIRDLQHLMDRIEQRSGELEQRAAHIERRCHELKRWAEQIERPERRPQRGPERAFRDQGWQREREHRRPERDLERDRG